MKLSPAIRCEAAGRVIDGQGSCDGTMVYQSVFELLKRLLSQVVVDEQWYLVQYSDIAKVISPSEDIY